MWVRGSVESQYIGGTGVWTEEFLKMFLSGDMRGSRIGLRQGRIARMPFC